MTVTNDDGGKTAFFKAYATFQANAPKVEKTAENPHFRNRYAPLDEVVEKIRPALAEAGLVVIQTTSDDPSGSETIVLSTKLVHAESGEGIESLMPLLPSKRDAQGIGAALTYARRYALVTILGLATEDDDDGNAASAPQARRSPPRQAAAKPTDEQKLRLAAAMTAGSAVDAERFSTDAVQALAEKLAGGKLDTLTAKDFERVVKKVEAAAKAATEGA